MFGRHPAGGRRARQLLVVAVPVFLGVGLLQLADDGTSTDPSRLETRGAVLPSLLPVTPLGDRPAAEGPGTTLTVPANNEAAAVGTPGAVASSAPGAGSSVAGPPSTSRPSTASANRAIPARSSGVEGGVVGGVDGGAAGSASPASRSSDSSVEPSTSTVPPGSTTTTTLAPEITTTTTPAPEVTTTTTAPPRVSSPARVPSAEAEVVPLTNADRAAGNLGPLTRDSCLDNVASRYAEQLARSGVLAHNPGVEGAVTGCRPGATWGDNVGTAAPCDVALIEQKWMASATHRRNILTEAFRLIGVGVWTDGQGACWVQVVFSS